MFGGNSGAALYGAGRALVANGSKLIEWSKEEDGRASSFSSSDLTKSTLLMQPFNGMNVSRADDPKDGFIFSCVECKKTKSMTNSSRSTRCTACQSKSKSASYMVKNFTIPQRHGRIQRQTCVMLFLTHPWQRSK